MEIDLPHDDFYSAPISARYSKDVTRIEHRTRPRRESLGKRLGRTALRIHARDGHACTYCGATAQAAGAPLQIDHLTPRSAGGLDIPENLVIACRRCNSARQDRSVAAWIVYATTLGLALRVSTASQVRGLARRSLPEIPAIRRAA